VLLLGLGLDLVSLVPFYIMLWHGMI